MGEPLYESGRDVTLEYVGLRYRFAQADFAERVLRAARDLRLVDPGEEAPDLVALARSGTLGAASSTAGRLLASDPARVAEACYWLRKLVFRGTWTDVRVRAGLVTTVFDETTGSFRHQSDGHDLTPDWSTDVPDLRTPHS